MAGTMLLDSTGAWLKVKPFGGAGASGGPVTSTTPVELKAAVTSKRHFITTWRVTNKTKAEYPIMELIEKTTVPVIKATLSLASDTNLGLGFKEVHFDPPIECSSGVNVGIRSQGSVGDCYSSIDGFTEI